MARRETTFRLEEALLETVGRTASGDGVAPDEVIEEALRRYFGLRGLSVLEEISAQQAQNGVQLSEDAAMRIALDEIQAMRAERGGDRGD